MMYRVQQLKWALTAGPPSADDNALLAEQLTSAEHALFQTFSHNDQQHSLRVARLLIGAGHTTPQLLTAALLHDIGKTMVGLTIWDRCWIVLASRLIPRTVARWAEDPTRRDWMRRAFVVKQHHPEWSAQMLTRIASEPLAIELVRLHQDEVSAENNELNRLLRQLQWADDQS